MSSAIRAILAVATNFETVLNAARLLALDGDILFVFIGGGYYVGALKSNVETEGLGNRFRFLPRNRWKSSNSHYPPARAERYGIEA